MLPVKPLHDNVFIDIIDREVITKNLGNGKVLHLISDDHFGSHNPVEGRHPGARPRWARVLEIGHEVVDVQRGDLVLCDTLKWSRNIQLGRIGTLPILFWHINVSDILLINETGDGDKYLRAYQQVLDRMTPNLGRL